MDPDFLKEQLVMYMRNFNIGVDEARNRLVRGMRLSDTSNIDAVVQGLREQQAQNVVLDMPRGIRRQVAEDDLRQDEWYVGPTEFDKHWQGLRRHLTGGPLASVVDDIDLASHKVVAQLANPAVHKLKKKGLVVGHVQSGKTANYTAVMAKAADAGYRMVIVLSGLHNNLRQQTQIRIDQDLAAVPWFPLTTRTADFGSVSNGTALFDGAVRSIAVVKKNSSRLDRLREWLSDIPKEIRARSPILLLDDEADQATPNSLAARNQVTRINALVRDIWSEIQSGTYIGYTATPFANVFMNPDDATDMYPSDFIVELPRAAGYFGSERIFGRTSVGDADEPEEGLDMVREVTDDEAVALKAPGKKLDREGFDPELPESLRQAVCWFLIATAVRRHRGQSDKHSSMLVHTTQFVAPHFSMRRRIEAFVDELRAGVRRGETAHLRDQFEREITKAAEVASAEVPKWDDVQNRLGEVLGAVRVVVDNGVSSDRLDYERKTDAGQPVVETVIAVGGGTLSRGLTLEGLVVSYFTRTSNLYDTLLQMGRWFGYRNGYEDLPRIWMPSDLRKDFAFLALVEEEMREEMRRLEQMKGVTPRQFGLRVRAHPGRLAITARAKMFHAGPVQVSYSGQRHQTTVLHEKQSDVLTYNLNLTRKLLKKCMQHCERSTFEPSQSQFLGLESDALREYLMDFKFHVDQPGLNPEHMVGWIERAVPDVPWNVVVLGSSKAQRGLNGEVVNLGTVDMGLGHEVPMVNRSPLRDRDAGAANIKALLSQRDWTADLRPEDVLAGRKAGLSYEEIRRGRDVTEGLLIVYLVSPSSQALRETQRNSRRSMEAKVPLVGLGLVFPKAPFSEWDPHNATYYSVKPDWDPIVDEEVEDLVEEDTEGSAQVDATDAAVVRGA